MINFKTKTLIRLIPRRILPIIYIFIFLSQPCLANTGNQRLLPATLSPEVTLADIFFQSALANRILASGSKENISAKIQSELDHQISFLSDLKLQKKNLDPQYLNPAQQIKYLTQIKDFLKTQSDYSVYNLFHFLKTKYYFSKSYYELRDLLKQQTNWQKTIPLTWKTLNLKNELTSLRFVYLNSGLYGFSDFKVILDAGFKFTINNNDLFQAMQDFFHNPEVYQAILQHLEQGSDFNFKANESVDITILQPVEAGENAQIYKIQCTQDNNILANFALIIDTQAQEYNSLNQLNDSHVYKETRVLKKICRSNSKDA